MTPLTHTKREGQLQPDQRKVLAFLVRRFNGGESFYGFALIKVGLSRARVRRACRALRRKGLTEYQSGLCDCDGTFAGAGYSATQSGAAHLSAGRAKS